MHVILNEKKKKKKKVIPPRIRHLFDDRPMKRVAGGRKGEMKPTTLPLTKPLTSKQRKAKQAKLRAEVEKKALEEQKKKGKKGGAQPTKAKPGAKPGKGAAKEQKTVKKLAMVSSESVDDDSIQEKPEQAKPLYAQPIPQPAQFQYILAPQQPVQVYSQPQNVYYQQVTPQYASSQYARPLPTTYVPVAQQTPIYQPQQQQIATQPIYYQQQQPVYQPQQQPPQQVIYQQVPVQEQPQIVLNPVYRY